MKVLRFAVLFLVPLASACAESHCPLSSADGACLPQLARTEAEAACAEVADGDAVCHGGVYIHCAAGGAYVVDDCAARDAVCSEQSFGCQDVSAEYEPNADTFDPNGAGRGTDIPPGTGDVVAPASPGRGTDIPPGVGDVIAPSSVGRGMDVPPAAGEVVGPSSTPTRR